MTQQRKKLSYGAITRKVFHNRILFGRKVLLNIEVQNEEGEWEKISPIETPFIAPGFKSKTTKKQTRWQKRAKTGKPVLVYRQKHRERNKYAPNGRTIA